MPDGSKSGQDMNEIIQLIEELWPLYRKIAKAFQDNKRDDGIEAAKNLFALYQRLNDEIQPFKHGQ